MQPSDRQPWRRESPVLNPAFRTGKPAPNKGKEYPPIALSHDEAMALLNAPPRRGARGKRDRALLAMLYGTAMRIGEALALNESDLNPVAGTIKIRHGKGDKARTVGMPPEAWAYVNEWLAERKRLGITGHRRLFCTVVGDAKGRPLKRSVWTEAIKRYAKRAGIEKRVTSHVLRHTWTFRYVVKRKGSLLLAQQQLGHSRIDTTVRYANHVAPADLIEVAASDTWESEPANGGGALAQLLELLQRPDVAELVAQLRNVA